MITAKETKILKSFLSLSPDPEETFSYDELTGYLFGLAITPDIILPSEWLPSIFGGQMPVYANLEQMESMNDCLMNLFNKFTEDFHNNRLKFPFTIEDLTADQLEVVYEWVSGFEEALALRDEIWDPEEQEDIVNLNKEALYHSLMTIQGLVDPMEVMDFFDNLPDEVFQEAFPGLESEFENRELQIQMFLLASLPLSIQTLQEHAANMERKRQQSVVEKSLPDRRPDNQKGKKNNIIKVDFTRTRK